MLGFLPVFLLFLFFWYGVWKFIGKIFGDDR